MVNADAIAALASTAPRSDGAGRAAGDAAGRPRLRSAVMGRRTGAGGGAQAERAAAAAELPGRHRWPPAPPLRREGCHKPPRSRNFLVAFLNNKTPRRQLRRGHRTAKHRQRQRNASCCMKRIHLIRRASVTSAWLRGGPKPCRLGRATPRNLRCAPMWKSPNGGQP